MNIARLLCCVLRTTVKLIYLEVGLLAAHLLSFYRKKMSIET